MVTYYQQLQSKEWLSKRLEILKRDNFTCQCCGNKMGLEVHHTFYYIDKREPWNYPNESLITLCCWCHGELHEVTDIPCI